jgi:uncharacterized protein YdeI (YjbR/CyaY-like superfamily)
MGSFDPRVDAYIAGSAGFARPLLERLRAIVHEACPDVEETIKWRMPGFLHAGGILCMMAAFKQHVSFGFWKHALVVGDDVAREGAAREVTPREGTPREGTPREGMGSFGKMGSLRDLPPKRELVALIRRAMALNEQGVKTSGARKVRVPKPPPVAPDDLSAALSRNRQARVAFDGFSPSQQREYVEWITGAKRPETRQRRLAQALEWLAEGKPRNWKYMHC